MQTLDIGQQFINYYRQEGFTELAASSLLDPALPMTFVGSAGLAQIETAIEHGADHTGERYVLLQPCFRHFDIKKVGHSPIHLSLFQMAGAFDFGPIRPIDALSKIWHFLTNIVGLPHERLWGTYFTGGQLDGHTFPLDQQSYQAWQAIGLKPQQLIGLGVEGGFWKQGGGLNGREQLRKCGPTSEIFFECTPDQPCSTTCQPGCPCGRFVEIANILFIQAHIDQETLAYSPLVTPFAETVIGLERLAMVAQNQPTVFGIDVLASLVQIIAQFHQTTHTLLAHEITTAEHIIADHLRALLFLVADGAPPPGKGGRARIIRVLLRSILTQSKILKIENINFIANLNQILINQYPYLEMAQLKLQYYITQEQIIFEQTLLVGYQQINRLVDYNKKSINQQAVINLTQVYGFPFPLLNTHLRQMGIKLPHPLIFIR